MNSSERAPNGGSCREAGTIDALSAAVPMRINVDVQLTVMASVLYRLLEMRVERATECRDPHQLPRLVRQSGHVTVTDDEFIARLRSRAKVHYLQSAGHSEQREPIPLLGNKMPRVHLV